MFYNGHGVLCGEKQMRFAFVEDHRRVIPVNRLCACWDLSPRPRMRISSFIRSRSDVVLSSVIGTSTVDWESPIVRQGRKIAKYADRSAGNQHLPQAPLPRERFRPSAASETLTVSPGNSRFSKLLTFARVTLDGGCAGQCSLMRLRWMRSHRV